MCGSKKELENKFLFALGGGPSSTLRKSLTCMLKKIVCVCVCVCVKKHKGIHLGEIKLSIERVDPKNKL
jgi:hypothetical protein